MIALAIIGAAAIFINILMIIAVIMFLFIIQRDVKDSMMLGKMNSQALHSLVAMNTSLLSNMGNNYSPSADNVHRIFRTEDGKYESDSFDGLMHKIAHDSTNEIDPEDLKSLEDSFDDDPDEWEDKNECH